MTLMRKANKYQKLGEDINQWDDTTFLNKIKLTIAI